MNIPEHTDWLIIRKSDARNAKEFLDLISLTHYPIGCKVSLMGNERYSFLMERIIYEPEFSKELSRVEKIKCPGYGKQNGKCKAEWYRRAVKGYCLDCYNLYLDDMDKDFESQKERGAHEA